MERKFETLIKNLTDHELAIYVGYQYENMLKHARASLKQEISERGLTKTQLEMFFKERLVYPDHEAQKCCERCGSNKFFDDIDTEYVNKKYTADVYEVKSSRCRLCNLNPSKEPPKNLLKRLRWALFDKGKAQSVTFIKTMDLFDE